MSKNEIHENLAKIIKKCQILRAKHPSDYEMKCAKKIAEYSKIIIENNLVGKSENAYFAAQLCISNYLEFENKENII